MRKIFIPGWDSPDEEELQESFDQLKKLVCTKFKQSPDLDCGHELCEHLTNMIQRVYDIQGDLEELYGMVDEMRTIEVWVTTTDDPDGEPHLLARFEDEDADLIREQAISEWITQSLERLEREAGSASSDSTTDNQSDG